MGPPTQPLPLTATNLAMLQTRQAAQPARAGDEKPAQDQPRPTASSATGRGRLVDIVV